MNTASINQEKIHEWVNIFIEHVRKIGPEKHVHNEEGYKFKAVEIFQQKFNLEAPNIHKMLDEALEINNLTVGAMYFPRKMLLHFAEDFPEDTREILRHLFDEDHSITERINKTEQSFKKLLEKRKAQSNITFAHTYIELRFISLLLGFKSPERYNPIKPQEWKLFCRYINPEFNIPQHTTSGEKYELYNTHIESLRLYVKTIPEIQNIKAQLTQGPLFKDTEYRWMTQNIIYVTSRVIAYTNQIKDTDDRLPIQEPEVMEIEEDVTADVTNETERLEFAKEEHLEDFMVRNWYNVDFGEKLNLFMDEDGTVGRQYTTTVGIIDLLTTDEQGNFVILELKRGKAGREVVGQILAYITWVRKNLAKNGQTVRGVVVATKADDYLLAAQEAVTDTVSIKYYKASLSLEL